MKSIENDIFEYKRCRRWDKLTLHLPLCIRAPHSRAVQNKQYGRRHHLALSGGGALSSANCQSVAICGSVKLHSEQRSLYHDDGPSDCFFVNQYKARSKVSLSHSILLCHTLLALFCYQLMSPKSNHTIPPWRCSPRAHCYNGWWVVVLCLKANLDLGWAILLVFLGNLYSC